VLECPKCKDKYDIFMMPGDYFNYCPNCGKKLNPPVDEEDEDE
jgi:hypothetical protein